MIAIVFQIALLIYLFLTPPLIFALIWGAISASEQIRRTLKHFVLVWAPLMLVAAFLFATFSLKASISHDLIHTGPSASEGVFSISREFFEVCEKISFALLAAYGIHALFALIICLPREITARLNRYADADPEIARLRRRERELSQQKRDPSKLN